MGISTLAGVCWLVMMIVTQDDGGHNMSYNAISNTWKGQPDWKREDLIFYWHKLLHHRFDVREVRMAVRNLRSLGVSEDLLKRELGNLGVNQPDAD